MSVSEALVAQISQIDSSVTEVLKSSEVSAASIAIVTDGKLVSWANPS